GEIVDVDENSPAAAAQRINQFVAGDRKQPWRERRLGVPGMPLQMHRQQNVLHDVLGLIDRLPCPRQTAARRGPEHRRDGLEQTMIRRTVAGNGRQHQAGPFVFTFAHARSYIAIRSIFQFVTAAGTDHEVVTWPAGFHARPDNRRHEYSTGRLISSIDPADIYGFDTQKISRTTSVLSGTCCCPAFARCSPKIPFFCPAADTPQGLIAPLRAGKWGDFRMKIKASGHPALILATA